MTATVAGCSLCETFANAVKKAKDQEGPIRRRAAVEGWTDAWALHHVLDHRHDATPAKQSAA